MQYLILPDKNHPTHTAPNAGLVRVQEFADNVRIAPGPGTVRKDLTGYTALAAQTPAEKAAADALQVLDRAKARKLAALEAAYKADLAAGITLPLPDSSPAVNVTLAAGETDQVRFTQGCVVLSTAELGAADATAQNAFRASNVSTIFGRKVADAAGNQLDMTATQYRQLAVAYAQAIGAKQDALITKTAAVNAATTIAAVNAVV
jgi:hypothetical protein